MPVELMQTGFICMDIRIFYFSGSKEKKMERNHDRRIKINKESTL
jgi:hypothetical protein